MKIAVASGKGGTGKTFFATNLFRVLQQAGHRTALVDCDAEVPNDAVFFKTRPLMSWETKILCPQIDTEACTFCGACADHCHFHAITCIPAVHYIKVMPDLCHGCGSCLYDCHDGAILTDYKTIGKVTAYRTSSPIPDLFEARLKEGEHSPVSVIRHAVRQAEEWGNEYLILDAPPGCSCPFVNTVMDADRVILVTEPTPFGLSDLRHTVQVLRQLKKKFAVVINRADLGSSALKDWLTEEQIPLLAEIPFSREIAGFYAQGTIASDVLTEIQNLFHGLIPQIVKP